MIVELAVAAVAIVAAAALVDGALLRRRLRRMERHHRDSMVLAHNALAHQHRVVAGYARLHPDGLDPSHAAKSLQELGEELRGW